MLKTSGTGIDLQRRGRGMYLTTIAVQLPYATLAEPSEVLSHLDTIVGINKVSPPKPEHHLNYSKCLSRMLVACLSNTHMKCLYNLQQQNKSTGLELCPWRSTAFFLWQRPLIWGKKVICIGTLQRASQQKHMAPWQLVITVCAV